ncbi:OmpA family protein [Fulvivirga sedimenti]|uniref:OmpA family protein n=1 Tax=Fulvivirga sedimenti TaxID=2879465 RepID=A0A9X1KWK9_9BACT|nr:OmpA family protein [Fulvivirga sedimenti]MCA6073322.1 OmpA family protein [Fulvivirga sedimenti]
MRIFLTVLVLLLFLSGIDGLAQTYKKWMHKGDRAYRIEDYESAISFYKKALKLRKGNTKATYQLGLSYLYSSDKLPALEQIAKVYALSPKIDKHIEYQLGLAYIYHENFKDALRFFESYSKTPQSKKSNVYERIAQCISADSLKRNEINALVTPVDALNSKFHDYTPLVYGQGTKMIFTSNRPGGKRSRDGTYYEDIYWASFENGEWTDIQRMGPAINDSYHDAAGTLSPDERSLFVYYEYDGGNIYVSKNEKGTWGQPTPLDESVNTIFWETSATITADGNTLYFASERPDGIGGLDIYKTELGDNGQWKKPVNLGKVINTRYNEDAPYITPDGSRLYFGSAGHPGMGAEDIFYSDIINGELQPPVNLGYPINSIYLDNYFIPNTDGKSGYLASMRPGGKGMADIFYVEYDLTPVNKKPLIASAEPVKQNTPAKEPVKAISKPEPVVEQIKETKPKIATVLKGKVIDSKSGEPLLAEVKLVDNTNNVVLSRVQSDAAGDFELIIPRGGNYGVSTRLDGYLFNSLNFNLPEFTENQEVDTHILMRKAETGSKVVLKNIFFDSGKSELRTESLGELDRIKELLEDNPGLVVQINGHTDNVGNAIANKILSKKRADAVVQFLINNGISANRLSAKGFGEERPLVSNDDEVDGREINRRTEIEIIRTGMESSTSP